MSSNLNGGKDKTKSQTLVKYARLYEP